MARLTKVYNTDDDDSGYVGRRNLPLVAGDKLMVSIITNHPHQFLAICKAKAIQKVNPHMHAFLCTCVCACALGPKTFIT